MLALQNHQLIKAMVALSDFIPTIKKHAKNARVSQNQMDNKTSEFVPDAASLDDKSQKSIKLLTMIACTLDNAVNLEQTEQQELNQTLTDHLPTVTQKITAGLPEGHKNALDNLNANIQEGIQTQNNLLQLGPDEKLQAPEVIPPQPDHLIAKAKIDQQTPPAAETTKVNLLSEDKINEQKEEKPAVETQTLTLISSKVFESLPKQAQNEAISAANTIVDCGGGIAGSVSSGPAVGKGQTQEVGLGA